jgi:hypothetical protein
MTLDDFVEAVTYPPFIVSVAILTGLFFVIQSF